jgi:two-component system, NtrC family, nitrogen regulation response regulator NtrX
MAKILVVDDEPTSLAIVKKILSEAGHEALSAGTADEALGKIREVKFDVVVTDFNMPGKNGIELTKEALEIEPELVVILITAYASIKSVVEAIKLGASDYLSKPVVKEELLLSVAGGLEKIKLLRENTFLKDRLEKTSQNGVDEFEYLTSSAKVKEILDETKKAAASDSAILITGENGTGKEILAKYIYKNSSRASQPFVVINCAAIPEQLLESELFGHVRGAFTGAVKDKKGYFEIADNGTIFLDEIGEISPQIQVKLLRVLQEKEFSRVGDTKIQTSNIRIIAATNKNLLSRIEEGLFREDLFYRLNVFEFHLPPLKERPEDIMYYFDIFVENISSKNGKKIKKTDSAVVNKLNSYSWPGNIRELKNIAERVTILCENGVITADLLPGKFLLNGKNTVLTTDYNQNKEMIIRNFEINFITKFLKLNKGNVAATARTINFHPVSLRQKISKLGINPEKVKYN